MYVDTGEVVAGESVAAVDGDGDVYLATDEPASSVFGLSKEADKAAERVALPGLAPAPFRRLEPEPKSESPAAEPVVAGFNGGGPPAIERTALVSALKGGA